MNIIKRLNTFIIAIALLFNFSTSQVFAKSVSNNNGWIEFQGVKDVPLNKEWTIEFNQNASYDKIDGIVISKDNTFIPALIKIENNNIIKVNPVKPYEANSEYTLKIFLANNKKYFMNFHTTKLDDCNNYPSIDFSEDAIIKIEANASKGFYAPYYLFIPRGANNNTNSHMLVEPNNTGRTSDDTKLHEEDAKNLLQYGVPNKFSNALNVPLLVPCFVRPESDGRIYTHALDKDTIKVNDGFLKRIDLQLINMINDAKNILAKNGLKVNEKIFMSGYSASGNFTNRFTALHPEIVRAVASGGVNGMPILPLKELEGYTLNYQVGIADLEQLIGKPFNLDEYKKVAQYIYMGELDRNDTLPYRDAYDEEDAELTRKILGDNMMPDRWEKSKKIYKYVGVSSQMVTYSGTSHEIKNEMIEDIVEFFKANSQIEEGIAKIEPYKYPYVEYKELEEVHIKSAKWNSDKEISTSLKLNDNEIALFTEEWMEGQDYHQMRTFLNNLPNEDWKFTLKAEGYEEVKAHLNGGSFSANPQGFILELSQEELNKMISGVEYKIYPHKSSDKYFFTVNDGVVIKK